MQKHPKNPILSPNKDNSWESDATFNGSVVKDGDTFHLLYRAMSGEQEINGKRLRVSSIGHSMSSDGINFTKRQQFLKPETVWDKYGCEDPRVTKIGDEFFLFYTALSDYPFYPLAIKIGVAVFTDFAKPSERHLVTPFNAKAMTLFPEKINGQYVALLTANTDMPPSRVSLAFFDKKEDIWSQAYWRKWYQALDEHVLALQRLNSDLLEVGAVPLLTEYGWLFLYAHIQHYYNEHQRAFGIEAVMLDRNDPRKIIARTENTLLLPEEKYETEGIVKNVVFPSGALIEGDTLSLYYGASDTHCALATTKLSDLFAKMRTDGATVLKLNRSPDNPIIESPPSHSWEAHGTFNPAAIYENDTVHILYRAMSSDNTSSFGYAASKDGLQITERAISAVYTPRAGFEDKKKEGANSGCEDPRLSKIGDRIYMCYTAYDGMNAPRVALTSIAVADFVNKNFNWEKPVLISPPGLDDKDTCILPERVHDKYIIYHRIENNIVIDYVDSLDFDGKTWLRSIEYITGREGMWDGEKIGICAPPIKSEHGWVLLYHGISTTDREYRVGAMLLSPEDPSTVLARTDYPLLEPETRYEREGVVGNVVFPCGNVVIDGMLYVYYGGADKVACVATIEFQKLVDYLVDLRKKKYLL